MKRIFTILFLLSSCKLSFCQTGRITGTVKDSATRIPLELATVTVFDEDSSIITYKLSDKDGNFTIEKLPLKKLLPLSITYSGFNSYYTTLQLNAGQTDTVTVFMTVSNNDSGVTVTAAIPIRMNGDTLEINPAAFKMKNDAVVEELLNAIDGITIWSDGTITVNGRQVQNLLVDGKPFMGSTDSRIATQNLPKSAIEKIQLYQEYDRSKIGQQAQQPQDSLLTMNIKLKESSKKGYFGKAGAGYGTMDRFESDLSFQVYTKRSSLGIGGGLNNINKNIGNLQDMFRNNTYRNYNPNLYNVGRFGSDGINRNHSIGGVLTHNFIESSNSRQNDRITLNYNKSGTNTFVTNQSFQNRATVNNPQFIRDEGVDNREIDKHDIAINYIKTNSYSDNLDLNGTINTTRERNNSVHSTEVRDTLNQLQSTNFSTEQQVSNSDNESLNVSFAKGDNENPLKRFNVNVSAERSNSLADRDVITVFRSFTDASKDDYNNRHYKRKGQSVNISADLNYTGFKRLLLGRYNLFGIDLQLNQRFNYTRETDNARVSDFDTTNKVYVINADLSNNNKRELIEYSPALNLSKNWFKYRESFYRSLFIQFRVMEDFKTDRNSSSFTKRNLDRSFQFFRYEGSLSYQYQARQKYRYGTNLNYSKRYEYPSIDRLYTIVDDLYAYDISIGNPFLRNSVNHAVNLYANYNTENPKSIYSVNANISAGYTLTLDPVTDSTINDLSGKRFSYFINADNSNSVNINPRINISRKLKKNSIQLMYNGQFRTSKTPNYVDGVSNISRTQNISHSLSLQFSLNTIMVFNLQQDLRRNNSRTTASGLRSFENRNNTTKLGVVLNCSKNLTISSTMDRIGSSNVDKPIYLWNTFATYRFMKQQGELKFSAMDMLKQYQNIVNYAYSYGTVTRVTNGLQQYFLLTFSYYPRKFGKTELKRQEIKREW